MAEANSEAKNVKTGMSKQDRLDVARSVLAAELEAGTSPDLAKVASEAGVSERVVRGIWGALVKKAQNSPQSAPSGYQVPQVPAQIAYQPPQIGYPVPPVGYVPPPSGVVITFTPDQWETFKRSLMKKDADLAGSWEAVPGIKQAVSGSFGVSVPPQERDLATEVERELEAEDRVMRKMELRAKIEHRRRELGLSPTYTTDPYRQGPGNPSGLEKKVDELAENFRRMTERRDIDLVKDAMQKQIDDLKATGRDKTTDPKVEYLEKEIQRLKDEDEKRERQEMYRMFQDQAKSQGLGMNDFMKLWTDFEARRAESNSKYEAMLGAAKEKGDVYRMQIQTDKEKEQKDEMRQLREEIRSLTKQGGGGLDKILEGVKTAKEIGKEFQPQTGSKAEEMGYEVLKDLKDVAKGYTEEYIKSKARASGGAPQGVNTFACRKCGYSIPVPDPNVSQITCPSCNETYHKSGQRTPAQQQPPPTEAATAETVSPSSELYFPGSENLPP